MKIFHFEELPQAVSELYNKVSNIETLLLSISNEPQPKADELLTVQGAAKFLSVAVSTIYALISKGELPVMKRSKRCYFLQADLINFLKEGRKKTNAEIEASADQFLIKKKRG